MLPVNAPLSLSKADAVRVEGYLIITVTLYNKICIMARKKRISGFLALTHLEVNMIGLGVPGISDKGYGRAFLYLFPGFYEIFFVMGINRIEVSGVF